MPSGWYSCNSYAISKDNTPQGFVLFVQFVFSKIKRQILLDSNIKKVTATIHFKSSCRCSLRLFLVGEGGEGVEDDGEDSEGCVVCPQLGNGGSLQIYRAQNLYIVSWRQYEREALRPHWH